MVNDGVDEVHGVNDEVNDGVNDGVDEVHDGVNDLNFMAEFMVNDPQIRRSDVNILNPNGK